MTRLKTLLLVGLFLPLAAAAHAQPALDIPSADGSLTHAAWKPAGRIERWIVSLHGTGGSANVYAVAAIDNGRGRKLFSLYVASSGGVALDYPPTRAILDGRFGPRPLAGTRWVTACGERDPNPDRDGCPGMRRTGQWLKEQGATLLDAIEDPQSGHSALQLNPRNAERLLELFGR
jgi:hypothetical protein